MADMVYPMRKRCRKCRRFFGPLVIKGQWCSYHCAGLEQPSIDRMEWPRQHYTPLPWGRKAKTFFNSVGEATAPWMPVATAYRCDYCWGWHRATPRE